MSATTFIYGLCDPRTGFCRYVGKADDPEVRLYRHRCSDGKKCRRVSWLKSLKSQGLKPEMFVFEEVPIADWQQSERFWIEYMRFLGCSLVNSTTGGDGGKKVSDATREKLRQIALARPKPSLETRLKMAAAHTGKPHPNSGWKLPHPNKGKNISESHRLKIVKALIGRNVSPETRLKISIGERRTKSLKKCSHKDQMMLGLCAV